MKKILLLGFYTSFITLSTVCYGQQTNEVKTIRIKKETQFVKAAFDDTEFKAIAFDRFGNPHENAIKSYTIFFKEGRSVYESQVVGNTFSQKTINYLTKKKKFATKICLIKIVAEDKDGHLEDLPDLCDIVIFPDCKKVNKH